MSANAAGEHGAEAFKHALPFDADAPTRRTAANIDREAMTYLHDKALNLAGKVSNAIRGT